MVRKVESALVARLGTVVFVVALGLPAVLSPAAAREAVVVASVETAPPSVTHVVVDAASVIDLPELRLAFVPYEEPEAAAASTVEPVAVLGVSAAPPPPAPTWPPPVPLVTDGTVVASWYGPGFYGNRTACGQDYTPEILGVAHRTLPCGTQIRITSPAGRTVVVPVIDRGPFIAGRSLDLSNATRAALSCSDLCHVRMTVLQ